MIGSTECESGTYGRECKSNCGHCFNSTDCFHVNGTCLKGCDAGFLGNMCKTRNTFFSLNSALHVRISQKKVISTLNATLR